MKGSTSASATHLSVEEISLGDYVITGGELPALIMIDAAMRHIPGVLGDPHSAQQESFVESLLDYPHFTRPAELRGQTVPDVLLSGNHEAIRRWRRKESLRQTLLKRPDLLDHHPLNTEDQQLLGEIEHDLYLGGMRSAETLKEETSHESVRTFRTIVRHRISSIL